MNYVLPLLEVIDITLVWVVCEGGMYVCVGVCLCVCVGVCLCVCVGVNV